MPLRELRQRAHKASRLFVRFKQHSAEAAVALQSLSPRQLKEVNGEYELVVEGSEDCWIREMARISERHPLEHLEIRAADLEEIFFDLYGHASTEKAAAH